VVIVQDLGPDKVFNGAFIRAEREQQADVKAREMFPNFPDQD